MGRALSWFVLCVFSLLLVGFAPPRDPRVQAVVLPDLGGESIEAAAHRRLHRSDGVVLVVAISEKKMRIETGPHARAMLSDDAAQRILDERMRPLLREGRTDEAVDVGITAIEDALRAPTSHTTLSPAAWVGCGLGIAGVLLLVATAANAGARRRRSTRSSDVPHVPYVDTSGSSGFSGGGGASSSW